MKNLICYEELTEIKFMNTVFSHLKTIIQPKQTTKKKGVPLLSHTIYYADQVKLVFIVYLFDANRCGYKTTRAANASTAMY
jgi:hypothetical protein